MDEKSSVRIQLKQHQDLLEEFTVCRFPVPITLCKLGALGGTDVPNSEGFGCLGICRTRCAPGTTGPEANTASRSLGYH